MAHGAGFVQLGLRGGGGTDAFWGVERIVAFVHVFTVTVLSLSSDMLYRVGNVETTMKWILGIFISLLVVTAHAKDEEAWDKLVWDYGEFVERFEMRQWDEVFRFVRPQTKAGFGGEMGVAGVKQVFVDNGRCFTAMVTALKQGCKKLDVETGLLCLAPPQFADSSVVYTGARAGFSYNRDEERWFVDYLICGGD